MPLEPRKVSSDALAAWKNLAMQQFRKNLAATLPWLILAYVLLGTFLYQLQQALSSAWSPLVFFTELSFGATVLFFVHACMANVVHAQLFSDRPPGLQSLLRSLPSVFSVVQFQAFCSRYRLVFFAVGLALLNVAAPGKSNLLIASDSSGGVSQVLSILSGAQLAAILAILALHEYFGVAPHVGIAFRLPAAESVAMAQSAARLNFKILRVYDTSLVLFIFLAAIPFVGLLGFLFLQYVSAVAFGDIFQCDIKNLQEQKSSLGIVRPVAT